MEDPRAFPYGLANSASEYVHHIPHLFMDPMERDHVSDLHILDLPQPPSHHIVNMVVIEEAPQISVHTLHVDGSSSTRSSTGSVHTEVLHPEDNDYDLYLPP